MGFDRAGTSTSDERDQEIWDQLNPKTAVYVSDVSERKKLVKRTIWFAGYKAAAKAQMRLACQAFDGTVEIICLKGGLVTDVEQDEMDTIISDGIKDAEKSGVECKIEKKVMGFYSFVQEYGEPYGVTVESLLAQTSSGAVVREHGTPEPLPELLVVRSELKPTARPQPEPEATVSAGVAPTFSPGVKSWSEHQLATWIRDVLKFEDVAQVVTEHGVDGATATQMDKDDWKELGVSGFKAAKAVAQVEKLV